MKNIRQIMRNDLDPQKLCSVGGIIYININSTFNCISLFTKHGVLNRNTLIYIFFLREREREREIWYLF